MVDRIYHGHLGIGEIVSGVALVANDNFSARYDLDRIEGVFSRRAHKLYNERYVDRILILNTAKGGVATAWMLSEMKSRGMAPAALILNASNTIMAQGAAHANLPFMDRFDADVTTVVQTGDRVTVDPQAGILIVHDEGSEAPS